MSKKNKKNRFSHRYSRRRFIANSSLSLAAAQLSGLPGIGIPTARSQSGTPRKFVQIFLTGGWDSALATDPVIGSKQTSGNYQADYNGLSTSTVTGKSNLVVGPGLNTGLSAFASMNTAFVNGMFVEVTAHELAVNYLYSGRLSLSRSREYPAFIAVAGAAGTNFPPFVNIGDRLPLGETALTAPPLASVSPSGVSMLLQGPYNEWEDHGLADRGQVLIDGLDQRFVSNLQGNSAQSILPWQNSSRGIPDLYASGYPALMAFDDALKTRYNFSNEWESNAPSCLAAAYLSLNARLSRYVNLAFGNYDTHTNHLNQHTTEMQGFASALSVFVNDLRTTPDPDNSSESLADNTTILIFSEFVRTPKFNIQQGTDHWQAGSAIVMGAGVRDNTIVGSTGDDAEAMGWDAGPVARSQSTAILPDHLAAAVLRQLGLTSQADEISTGGVLDALFL